MPMTPPPEKTTNKALACPSSFAAADVLTFAIVAACMPKNPAAIEQNAPLRNATAVAPLIFQLNSTSFPKLEESDFYDPKTSAHYGLSHLRFCLNTAGNEIAALAMYNAGANKVRKNSTPQITLDYISKIQNYKRDLEDNFAVEVLALYNTETQKNLLAKKF